MTGVHNHKTVDVLITVAVKRLKILNLTGNLAQSIASHRRSVRLLDTATAITVCICGHN